MDVRLLYLLLYGWQLGTVLHPSSVPLSFSESFVASSAYMACVGPLSLHARFFLVPRWLLPRVCAGPSPQASCLETGETVAIKKVLQDKRYKNRELQIMRMLDHPNIVALRHCFFSTTDKDELYLNLVLEFVPETVYRIAKHYTKMNQRMPLLYVKLYTYQVRVGARWSEGGRGRRPNGRRSAAAADEPMLWMRDDAARSVNVNGWWCLNPRSCL